MIQAADAFMRNDHKFAAFHTSVFHRNAKCPSNELQVCHKSKGEKKFPGLTLFSNENSTDEEYDSWNNFPVYFHIVSFRLRRMRQIEEVGVRAEILEKRLLLKMKHHFNPADNTSSCKTVMSEKAMSDATQK